MKEEEKIELIGTVLAPGEFAILDVKEHSVVVLQNVSGKPEIFEVKK